jgi:HPt (histidine-containing phosphotransfer) domain-containing protein
MAGMNDYVTKPFDEINLIETIAKYTIIKGEKVSKVVKPNKIKNLYNLNSLHNLSRGNIEFVKKMVTIFIQQTNTTLEKIERSIETKNYIEVSQLIHKIKPSIEGIGVTSISDSVKKLEKIAKETEDVEQIESLFLTIKEVLTVVIEQLKENEIDI